MIYDKSNTTHPDYVRLSVAVDEDDTITLKITAASDATEIVMTEPLILWLCEELSSALVRTQTRARMRELDKTP